MDTQRLILFLVFSFSLLLLWEAWQKELRPPAPANPPTQGPVPTPSTGPATPTGSSGDALPTTLAPAGKPRERLRVHTDTMLAEVDTQGGDIVHLELLQHKDTLQETKNFVLFGSEHRYSAQSGLIGEGLPNHRTLFRASAREFTLEQGQDRLDVRLQANTPEGIRVTKILTFYPASYRIDITEEIANGTATPFEAHAYFQITRDGKSPGAIPTWPRRTLALRSTPRGTNFTRSLSRISRRAKLPILRAPTTAGSRSFSTISSLLSFPRTSYRASSMGESSPKISMRSA